MCEPYSAQRMSGFLHDIRQEILAGKSDKAITMLLHLADVIYSNDEADEVGECDDCGATYDVASRDGRCGDCGNCGDCCEH